MTGNGKMKLWISRLLLAFVLVTLGFAWGRKTAPRAESTGTAESSGAKLIVYSAHMTFRCVECNQIELTTREVLEADFAEELASGIIEFHSVDYMQDAEFARKYDISSSTVILARRDGGFERLDEVWTKTRQPEELVSYLRNAIRSQLDKEES